MAFEFKLPDLGEGIHEAQVLAWKVTPGQYRILVGGGSRSLQLSGSVQM